MASLPGMGDLHHETSSASSSIPSLPSHASMHEEIGEPRKRRTSHAQGDAQSTKIEESPSRSSEKLHRRGNGTLSRSASCGESLAAEEMLAAGASRQRVGSTARGSMTSLCDKGDDMMFEEEIGASSKPVNGFWKSDNALKEGQHAGIHGLRSRPSSSSLSSTSRLTEKRLSEAHSANNGEREVDRAGTSTPPKEYPCRETMDYGLKQTSPIRKPSLRIDCPPFIPQRLDEARKHRDTPGNGHRRNSKTLATPGNEDQRTGRMPDYKDSLTPSQARDYRRTHANANSQAGGEKLHHTPSRPIPPTPLEQRPDPLYQPVPIPPFSVPTYLQLELDSAHSSRTHSHRSRNRDFPYESNAAKLERLQNFLLLPFTLEGLFTFGTLACLDAWLYTFTVLPLRFLKASYILCQSWAVNINENLGSLARATKVSITSLWTGASSSKKADEKAISASIAPEQDGAGQKDPTTTFTFPQKEGELVWHEQTKDRARKDQRHRRSDAWRRHRRMRSIPSTLVPDDKADILKGLLMIATCTLLLRFDASKAYHNIRGQAAIKLYVIFNVLEVGDRLLSAIGQDVLECLFSREALERGPDGRSKVLRPLWLFAIALIYTVTHASALFYQVITLNVAVNSYSNALITLLMSNQFVEIKSTVFKKFEKENLFQLTCADVVERFQLWLMLTVIASRNIVETGSFNFFGGLTSLATSAVESASASSAAQATVPRSSSSILPKAFTILPSLFSPLSKFNSVIPAATQILGPFFVVLGSEMLVDWLKHAYINKFNNNRPIIYSRFLDILAKDYYTNAFGNQNLTRRLGLPVIPLACLFFRISVQTYQMFLTAWLPTSSSFEPSNTISLATIREQYSSLPPSPASSLGLSSSTLPLPLPLPQAVHHGFGLVQQFFRSMTAYVIPSPSSIVPIVTVILVLSLYSLLLLTKLILGMFLLSYSQTRMKSMKAKERRLERRHSLQDHNRGHQQYPLSPPADKQPPLPPQGDTIEGARRFGPFGTVELDDEKRRWIYADDPDGYRRLKDRDAQATKQKGDNLDTVERYEMAAKRIW